MNSIFHKFRQRNISINWFLHYRVICSARICTGLAILRLIADLLRFEKTTHLLHAFMF